MIEHYANRDYYFKQWLAWRLWSLPKKAWPTQLRFFKTRLRTLPWFYWVPQSKCQGVHELWSDIHTNRQTELLSLLFFFYLNSLDYFILTIWTLHLIVFLLVELFTWLFSYYAVGLFTLLFLFLVKLFISIFSY